jgi:thiol-disulfide isomerase/thioredoxin
MVMIRFRNILFSSLAVALMFSAFNSPVAAGKFNRKLSVGDQAPDWSELIGTDDKKHSLENYRDFSVLVIVFTCNHCPVAKMYEDRFVAFSKQYKKKGVSFVAISCSLFPADRLEKMKQHSDEKKYPFDYVTDPTQQTGRDYGATATPHVFVLNKKRQIAYMGAFDDSKDPQKAERHYVRDAVEALLAKKKIEIIETRQFGCAIEYRKKLSGDIALKVVGPREFKAVLAKQKGKVVVVDFWATWCLPCLKHFPKTVGWSCKYPKNKLVVISLSMDDSDPESKEAALTFLKKQNATIINLMSNLGGEEKAMAAFEIDGGAIPHFKIYDRKGKVFKTFGGDPDTPFTHMDVEAALVKVLNRK